MFTQKYLHVRSFGQTGNLWKLIQINLRVEVNKAFWLFVLFWHFFFLAISPYLNAENCSLL